MSPLVLLLALPPALLGTHPQTDLQAASATSAAVRSEGDHGDDLTRDRRRILILEDGTARRGRARQVDGRWERRVDREWAPVQGTVVRVRLEKEAEAEARRRSSKVGRHAHDERVELARWMLSEGLMAEAVRELDRVLVRDADHAPTYALIRETHIELDLGLPENAHPAEVLSETLKHGARGGPVEREIAALRVAEFGELVDLHELVETELKRPQPSRRGFATLLAQRLFPEELAGELMPKLARRALLDPMSNVRHSAALALRSADDPAVVDPLASGLVSRHHPIRMRATAALGEVGQPAAVAPLMASLSALQAAGGAPVGVRGNLFSGLQIALVTDYDVEIAQAASIGDPIVSIQESGVVHDVRAQAQIDRRAEVKVTVAALSKLTGHEGKSADDWVEWWKTVGQDWVELQNARRQGTGARRTTTRR